MRLSRASRLWPPRPDQISDPLTGFPTVASIGTTSYLDRPTMIFYPGPGLISTLHLAASLLVVSRSIDRGRRRSELPGARVYYDPSTKVLITKLIAGPHHEYASSRFAEMFREKVVSAGLPCDSFHDFGTTRYGVPGSREKRPIRLCVRVFGSGKSIGRPS